jgi:hypothetical protein
MASLVHPAQVTLLREYVQGVNEMMFVLPSGAFDPQRHSGGMAAAQAELSEEVSDVNSTLQGPGISAAVQCAASQLIMML